MKKSTSLLKKYIFIILTAMILIPITFPLTGFIITQLWTNVIETEVDYDYQEIEEAWNDKASSLTEERPEEIQEMFLSMQKLYPEASMFWVDSQGKSHSPLSKNEDIPSQWTANYSVDFIKNSSQQGLYTVVNHIGEGNKEAFIVTQIPEKYVEHSIQQQRITFIITTFVILITFIIFSWFFFRGISKRLARLQKAMQLSEEQPIPKAITISKIDEIGLLEQNFNNMIQVLEESRIKERKEEELRRELITNLSHDLRTPLMILRTQINSLENEVVSNKGKETIILVDDKIHYISELIDNLLSYSLLTSEKYPFNPVNTNITSLLRKIIASWYNTLEGEGFFIDIEIPEKQIFWYVDPNWFQRIVDNVIQNVVRHAREGKFIGIYIYVKNNKELISIVDHGPGFRNNNISSQGVGIGLSIISLMSKKMSINWSIDSNCERTIISFENK